MTYMHLDEAPLSEIMERLKAKPAKTAASTVALPLWRVTINAIQIDMLGRDVAQVEFTYFVRAANESAACDKAEQYIPWYPANNEGVILPKYELANDPKAVLHEANPEVAMSEHRQRREAALERMRIRMQKYV